MAEIRSLLDLPAGVELPPRAEVEDTLTSGYAYALDLERELRTMLRSEARPSQSELNDVSSRLADTDDKLAGVRAMLASLRAQALG
jgi:hypothetical protein